MNWDLGGITTCRTGTQAVTCHVRILMKLILVDVMILT